MKTMSNKPSSAILFLYEGDTEGGFYDMLFEKLELNRKVQIKKKCINGNININSKISDKVFAYLENEKNDHVKYLTVFVAYDREVPRAELATRLNKKGILEKAGPRLKDLHEIIATQMLESWFFIDIEGIYNHLDIPKSKRAPHKYKDYEKFRWQDLHEIFKAKDKKAKYMKGEGSLNLIKSLDILKIYKNCPDLNTGMNQIFSIAGLKKPQ